MQEIITNKITDSSTGKEFDKLASDASNIIIAVAFFSDSTIIKKLIDSGKKISLIVSLRPPTNYYSLKEILHKENVEILFLGDDFHSKIYCFYNSKEKIISSIIGSSNFTSGGFNNNIETNLITTDKDVLNQIEISLTEILNISTKLQPDTLKQYKKRYDLFIKYKEKDKNPVRLRNTHPKQKILKKASEYLNFWRIADEVKDIVGDIAIKEYPSVPKYLVIDHFWHWVVKVCNKTRLNILVSNEAKREKNITKFFVEYCKWDKSSTNAYTVEMGVKSKVIQGILASHKISKLNKKDALLVFQSLHATQMPIQRFKADKDFIKDNKIANIRKSFIHLLDDTLLIEVRIHDLISKNSTYKLEHFGTSCVQELIGWANPEVMPIRNNKADDAVKLLGFKQ